MSLFSNEVLKLFFEKDMAATHCSSLTGDKDFLTEEGKSVGLHLEEKIKNTLGHIQELLAEKKSQDEVVLMLQSKLTDVLSEQYSALIQIETLTSEINNIQGNVMLTFKEEKEKVQASLETVLSERDCAMSRIDNLQAENSSIQIELSETREAKVKTEEQVAKLFSQLSNHEEEVVGLKTKLNALEKRLKDTE